MTPDAGWLSGMPGNRCLNSGLSLAERMLTMPPFSPIFIMPSHKVSTPVRPMLRLNAVLADSNVELTMSLNTSVSFQNTNLHTAVTNAMMKNAIQM